MLAGRVALVTGASRGIGRAIATRLDQEGMHLALVARSQEGLESLRAELLARNGDRRILVLPADVTDPASVANAVAATEAEFGGIDLLVNNAGVTESKDASLWESDAHDWWQVITTNVLGPMLFCQAVVPGMVRRGSGRIVNINSLRAVHALPTQTAYGVSKAALAKVTQGLASGLAGTGVLAFDYSPGRVKTDLTHQLGMAARPDTTWTPLEQAAEGIVVIARGSLDPLAGRFLHAHDDWQQMGDLAEDIVRHGGRTLVVSAAFEGDPLSSRRVGGQGADAGGRTAETRVR
jgi:3-oxoacyl-[acyl-carrier protein] reductase